MVTAMEPSKPKRWTTEGFFYRRERQNHNRILSSDKLREMWERHRRGEPTTALAKECPEIRYETLRRALRKLDYLHKKGV